MKISFIGVGNMASAILGGILSGRGKFSADDVILCDKCPEKAAAFHGIKSVSSAAEAVNGADYILFAVKPQNFPEMLDEIKSNCADLSAKVFITIAAGISCQTVTDALGDVPVVRVMPNTPLLIGKGTTALCRNAHVTDSEFDIAFSLFSNLGLAVELQENNMNEIIALTSSSPAYIFLFIKSMADAASAQGLDLPYDELIKLACSAVIGSAELMMNSTDSAEALIQKVTSKGGTTEQAMRVFNEKCLPLTVKEAMDACTKRAYELSGK